MSQTFFRLLVRKSKFLKENYHFYIFCASYAVPLIIVALNVGLAVGYVDNLPVDGFYRLNGNNQYATSRCCKALLHCFKFCDIDVQSLIVYIKSNVFFVPSRGMQSRNYSSVPVGFEPTT